MGSFKSRDHAAVVPLPCQFGADGDLWQGLLLVQRQLLTLYASLKLLCSNNSTYISNKHHQQQLEQLSLFPCQACSLSSAW